MSVEFSEQEIETVCAAIAHRRSMGLARVYAEMPIDKAKVERVLQAADWAPSHGETEPWRFTVFTGDSRLELGKAFAEAYKSDTTEETFKPNTYEANLNKAVSAPVWISIGMSPKLREDGSLMMTELEEMLAVACAVQNLHVVANAQGLAGMWLSKGVYVHPHVARFVGLEPPSCLLGFFFLGYPNIPWTEGERLPLETKVRWMEE